MAAAAARETRPARRVLIVEDEHDVCELISDALEAAGFDPICAQNDRQAYAALANSADYAGLIVDINLGAGTTGYDVARFARQSRTWLPVIYVSGQSTPASFAAFGVPRSVFVQKPFRPDDLAEKLRALVSGDDEPG